MKKYIFMAVAGLLALSGCSSDDNEQTAPKAPQLMTFTAGFGGTRTTLNSNNNSVSFDAEDAISIFSTHNTNAQFTTSSGGDEAEFTGTAVAGDGTYYAIYPYNNSYTFSGGIVSGVTIVNTQYINYFTQNQTWVKNSVISYATTTGSDLQFHNACALLKICNNTGSGALIQITVDEGEYLTGTFSLNTSTGELTATGGNNSVAAMILGENITGYIAIAPGSYTNFTVKTRNNNYSDWSSKTKASATFEAGKIYDLGSTSGIMNPGGLQSANIAGYIIYYSSGETWTNAITNHPEENAGWSCQNKYVIYTKDEDDSFVLWNFDIERLISPEDVINPSLRYGWREQ